MIMAIGESTSPPPKRSSRRSRSLSRSRGSRSRSRDSEDAINPGNNLYVTGLSTRVTESDIEKHFNREGKVLECHLVKDPHSKESRGFAFVTMETTKDAEHCVKNLNRSVMEGRLITVEKNVAWLKGNEGELRLLDNMKVLEIKEEAVGTGEDLVVTHLGGDMREILIPGNGEGDESLPMAGEEVTTLVAIRGEVTMGGGLTTLIVAIGGKVTTLVAIGGEVTTLVAIGGEVTTRGIGIVPSF